MPHILTALKRAEVPSSFYVPGWVAERSPATVEQIAAAGHEIGHHGYLHEPPATLSAEEEAEVLDRGSEILRGIVGEAPVGYRSPSWELSDVSLDLMSERGFRYDSSLMGSDAPYWVGARDSALVELPIHWALDDYPYFVFAPTDGRRLQAAPEQVESTWRDAFDELYRRGGVFTLTMHPYIIGRPGRVSMLETVDRVHAVEAGGDVREGGGCVRRVRFGVVVGATRIGPAAPRHIRWSRSGASRLVRLVRPRPLESGVGRHRWGERR